jgi:hypothetical protein
MRTTCHGSSPDLAARVIATSRRARLQWAPAMTKPDPPPNSKDLKPSRDATDSEDELFVLIVGPDDGPRLMRIEHKALEAATAQRHRIEVQVNGEPRAFDMYVPPRPARRDDTALACVVTDATSSR